MKKKSKSNPKMTNQKNPIIQKKKLTPEEKKFLQKQKPVIIPGIEFKSGKKKLDIYHSKDNYTDHQVYVEQGVLKHHGVKKIPDFQFEKEKAEFALNIDSIGRRRVYLIKKNKKKKSK